MPVEITKGKFEVTGTMEVTFPSPEAQRWLLVMRGEVQPDDLSSTTLLMDLPQRIQWAINEIKFDESNETKMWKLVRIAEFLSDLERSHESYGRKLHHLQRALLYRSLDFGREVMRMLIHERKAQESIHDQLAELRHMVMGARGRPSVVA